MLGGNCEKMVLITPSSITNQWPQQQTSITDDQIIDDHNNKVSSMASTNRKVLEKPEQLLLQQQPLKCPRCDSSNTKFCYYNNYSLSQPRHFCKACKRYWTRGGTLRNVPVGGGCRKNKRVKRPTDNSSSSNSNYSNSNSPSGTAANPCSPQIDILTASSTTSNHTISPLLFGLLPNNNNPWFNSRGVSSSGYDLLQSQLNSLGLGFSSGGMIMSSGENGFTTSNNNTLLSSNNYNSIFGSSSSSSSTSLMPSLVMPQKYMNNGGLKDGGNSFQGLGENRLEEEWNNGGVCQNQILDQQEQPHVVGLSDDPSSLYYWSTTSSGGASWNGHHQPPNISGPSVTPLI